MEKNKKYLVIMACLLFTVDFLYPMVFTYDSGHYMSYLPILSGNKPLVEWDPVRGFAFPLFLYIVNKLLGEGMNGLLIIYTILHILTFFMFYWLVCQVNKSLKKKINERFLTILIFIFIALDPLVIGYHHLVLTEALALIIALSLHFNRT